MKSFIAAVSVVITTLMGAASAQAQTEFPSRTITLVVTQAAGGGMDATARFLAKKLTDVLGQSVIVENKAGGAENVAISYVSKGQPGRLHDPSLQQQHHHQSEPLQESAVRREEGSAADSDASVHRR